MSLFSATLNATSTRQPSHHSHMLLLLPRESEVDNTHPLYTHSHTTAPHMAHFQPEVDFIDMPSIKQCPLPSSYPSSPASLSKLTLVCLAHALVAHGRLSYSELQSPTSVSDVSAVVRQVRELLRVGHSQWLQWVEEAAESASDGGEAELSSELSASSSSSTPTTADMSSPVSTLSMPDSPLFPASVTSSRSPSPPPNSRRTLTIVTRANGKRPHTSAAARRQSAAISSNSTTYMTAEVFIEYFQRSRSLSEAVKRITRDYPSYREVSIYARARRLECRFDDRGRCYQPKKAKGGNGASNGTTKGSNKEIEEEARGEQEDDSAGERQDEAVSGSRKRRRARHSRRRKVRRVERSEGDEHEEDDDQNHEKEEGSSDDGSDMQSESSYLSSSSSGSDSSSGSSVSMLELSESAGAAVAIASAQQASTEAAPNAMGALQLLAASAGSAAPPPSQGDRRNGAKHAPTASNTLDSFTDSAVPSTAAAKRVGKKEAVRRSAVLAPPLALHYTDWSPLTRRPLHAPSSVHRTGQSLSAGPTASSFPFRSAVLLPASSGYGHLPTSPALRPVFGPSCAFPPYVPSYLSTPFGSAPALSSMPLWPPLPALLVPSAAAMPSLASGRSPAIADSQLRFSFATMANNAMTAASSAHEKAAVAAPQLP